MSYKAFIRDEFMLGGKALFIARKLSNGRYAELQAPPDGFPIREREVSKYYEPQPFIHGQDGDEILQAILDAAWAEGMRPTGISGERGEIKRLEEHLGDMRALAFHKIGAEKPRGS